jgi:hypothetical protein
MIARHAAWYPLTKRERRLLWSPYIERLDRAIAAVGGLTPAYARALPNLAARQVAADVSHTAWLAAYHLLGRTIPGPVRATLSRARIRWRDRRGRRQWQA